jgi:hypothetical protein
MHCGDLRAHDGTVVTAEDVAFDPCDVAELPPRSSRGVLISVDVARATPGVTYRGTVLARGLPNAWVPIELVVPGG